MNVAPDKATVLVVDDTPSNIELMLDVLDADHELMVATSGQDALDLLAGGCRPDLILLDVMMPGMDGYEVCAALKARPATRDIPVIFVTARTDPDSETRGIEAGALDFIHKPIVPAVVRARVRHHLELVRHRFRLEELVHQRTCALAAARDAAESASRAKDEFLRNIGHEFRTPMTHIMGFAHLLQREVQSERGRNLLGKVLLASGRLEQVVNQVLDLARLQSGELQIMPVVFDLHAMLEELRKTVAPLAAAKGLALQVEPEPGLPTCLQGDAVRISQVLAELLHNAIKFSSQGRVSLRVRQVGAGPGSVSLRFEVEDQGIGMDAAQAGGLLFQQGDGSISREQGGSGAGLALCRRLLALMGSELVVDGRPGDGTTVGFELRLPRPERQPLCEMSAALEPIDWRRVGEVVSYLRRLLAEDDHRALLLCQHSGTLLGHLFDSHLDELLAAIEAYDFARARSLLLAAQAMHPEAGGG